jgi:hypothetical protein
MGTQGSSRMVDSDRGPNRGEAYGIASVTHVLEGLHFPISRQDLMQRYGNKIIQWTKEGQSYKLAECLRQVRQEQFNSITEITAAVSDAIQKSGGRR